MTNGPGKIDLDQLKQAIPIVELAYKLGLEIRGRQARCYNSQAHSNGDRNKSLGLDVTRNRYRCFACGEAGSIIDLYMNIKGVDLSQAIKDLAEMAGLSPASYKPSRSYDYRDAGPLPDVKPTTTEDDLDLYNRIYESFCLYCLDEPLDDESRSYLIGRGLSEDTLSKRFIFTLKDYQATDKHLKAEFKLDDLRKAGIVSDEGNLIFYKHKIIIPFLRDGRIVFLQGRRLDNEEPKYLHLKRPVQMYNLDTLTDAGKGKRIYICEGIFDALILEQSGYRAIAILGAGNFKREWTELFKGQDVVLCLDNDEAGRRGIDTLTEMFNLSGQGVTIKELPKGIKDINDFYLSL